MMEAVPKGRKAIIVSLVDTNLNAVVLARMGDDDFGHYFSTSQLTDTAKQLIDIWVAHLSNVQGRTIVADSVQYNNTITNLTHHFMNYCADSKQQEAVIFDGFNDQHGAAIGITVKLVRTQIMSFDNEL